MKLVSRRTGTLSDVEPQVIRHFDVRIKIKLHRMYDLIQDDMG